MFKTTIAAAAAAIAFAPAANALAGPYVNVETNAGWDWRRLHWSNYRRHVGYEGALGDSGASFYVQGGSLSYP